MARPVFLYCIRFYNDAVNWTSYITRNKAVNFYGNNNEKIRMRKKWKTLSWVL